jgi:glutamine synthetase
MSEGGITYLLWQDLVGVTRTRGVPTRDLSKRMAHGLGWARAGQALTAFGNIVDNPWGPMDEARQVPDPATVFTIPASGDAPDFHAVICDSLLEDGSPWPCAPRSFYRSALDALQAETGLSLMASFEHEFSVTGADFTPSAPFSIGAVLQQNRFLTELESALTHAGVKTYTVEPEYGVGQYEVACAPETGLKAGDVCVITREIIREIARRHGLTATFTPKPAADAVGNGAHVHFSLVDEAGHNRTYDPDGPMQLSSVAAHFSAGILAHVDALLALTAPVPVSYFRLGPHHWSTGYCAIGLQNREAALRVTPGLGSERERARGHNIEYRPCDGTASPYLVLGALVFAGLDGIRRELACPPGITVDPAEMSDAARAEAGVKLLPTSLASSLDALLADDEACAWFDREALDLYVGLKRWEVEAAAMGGEADTFARYRQAY